MLVDFSAPDALQRASTARYRPASRFWSARPGSTDAVARIARAAQPDCRPPGAEHLARIALLPDLVERAAARLGPEWDIEIIEVHHRMKADAPRARR